MSDTKYLYVKIETIPFYISNLTRCTQAARLKLEAAVPHTLMSQQLGYEHIDVKMFCVLEHLASKCHALKELFINCYT